MALLRTINYQKMLADLCLPTAEKVISRKCVHTSGAYKFDGNKINCSVFVSCMLNAIGLLPDGITMAHTDKNKPKTSLINCVTNTTKLKHFDWFEVNQKYADLDSKFKEPGCVYVYASSEAVKGYDGIYGCHSTGKTYTALSMIRHAKGTYEYTSNILWVGIPKLVKLPLVKTYSVSERCLDLVKEFEGARLKAYKDEVGVVTIGYGITNYDSAYTGKKIKMGMTITQKQADEWLYLVLTKKHLPRVLKYDEKYDFTISQIDALVSFDFNTGRLDSLLDNGERSIAEIRPKLLQYNKAGGVVYRGLTRRRQAELALFDSGKQTYDGQIPKFPKAGYFKSGDKDVEINKIERILACYGLYSGKVGDSSYGSGCVAGTKALQEMAGIPINGKFGKKCLDFILSNTR